MLVPVSIHHLSKWQTKRTVGKQFPYPDVPPSASLTTMFVDFFSCLNLRSGHTLTQCSSLPQTKQPSSLFFFFLKVVVCLGFELFSCLLFFLLLRDAFEFFFWTMLALGDSTHFPWCLLFFLLLRDAFEFFFWTILALRDSTHFPWLSFALALSSTLRDPISSATLNCCLLCFREVAKSL
jgi:hypothetical protein